MGLRKVGELLQKLQGPIGQQEPSVFERSLALAIVLILVLSLSAWLNDPRVPEAEDESSRGPEASGRAVEAMGEDSRAKASSNDREASQQGPPEIPEHASVSRGSLVPWFAQGPKRTNETSHSPRQPTAHAHNQATA